RGGGRVLWEGVGPWGWGLLAGRGGRRGGGGAGWGSAGAGGWGWGAMSCGCVVNGWLLSCSVVVGACAARWPARPTPRLGRGWLAVRAAHARVISTGACW